MALASLTALADITLFSICLNLDGLTDDYKFLRFPHVLKST